MQAINLLNSPYTNDFIVQSQRGMHVADFD